MGSTARVRTRYVRKDNRGEQRVERVEKKEYKLFLNEEVVQKQVEVLVKKFDIVNAELAGKCQETSKDIDGYLVMIEGYLETRDPRRTQYAAALSDKVHNDLKELFGYLDEAENSLEEEKSRIEEDTKLLEAEQRLLGRENRFEGREYRVLVKAARKQAEIDEDRKEAVLAKRKQLAATLFSLNQRLLQGYKTIYLPTLAADLQDVGQFQQMRKEIKQKWGKEPSSWEALLNLLKQIKLLLQAKAAFYASLAARNRRIIALNVQVAAVFSEKNKVYNQKFVLDKEYLAFLVQEQIDISHAQHMGKILHAL